MGAAKNAVLILNAFSIFTAGTYTYIAGYEPQSDVVEHSEIDLDVRDIIDLLPEADSGLLEDCTNCDWDTTYQADIQAAFAIWENGKNSAKSTSNRTIAGFSSGAATKSSGNGVDTDVDYKDNIYIAAMNSYWERKGLHMYTWGYDIIEDTFLGEEIANTINMGAVGDDFRREVIQKGIVYLNIFPYVIWEMQDALNDCNMGVVTMNDNSVHAWDEAVAFYTGSLEGVSPGGNAGLDSCADGNCELQFMLADKRCTNFGTCTADWDNNPTAGYSVVNRDIFRLFTSGRDQILGANHTLECPGINETMNEIAGRMLIPFIQGVQRYLYKTKDRQSAKEAGELFAFASAVLPFIDLVDSEAAEMLFDRAWNLDYTSHSWEEIKYAIEDTYPELGLGAGRGVVTCAQVGELAESSVILSPACKDPAESSSSSESGLETWAVILIVLLCVLLAATCVYGFCLKSKYEKVKPLIAANESAKDRATREM